jgi:hypothetical protein
MVCFFHPERQAVGVCAHCQRGICLECSAIVGDCMACRDRHEGEVNAANNARARTLLQAERMSSGYLRNAIFYGLVGVSFGAFGIIQYRFLGLQGVFFLGLGLFLLYAAGANLVESHKYR